MNEIRIYIAGISGTTNWVCVSAKDADEAIEKVKGKIKKANAAREIGFRQISNDEIL